MIWMNGSTVLLQDCPLPLNNRSKRKKMGCLFYIQQVQQVTKLSVSIMRLYILSGQIRYDKLGVCCYHSLPFLSLPALLYFIDSSLLIFFYINSILLLCISIQICLYNPILSASIVLAHLCRSHPPLSSVGRSPSL